MTVDLVIPTYNRADLLRRLLDSIAAAVRPPGVTVRTIVVDNNSSDATRAVVEEVASSWTERLDYRFEPIQSKSSALNNGLSATSADIVGMLDDDEEIHSRWFVVAERMFGSPTVDFVSGPYLPRWGAPPPPWLPRDYPAVIGWMEAGDRVLEYGGTYEGVMLGGNALVRRTVGEKAGWYDPALGRVGLKAGSGCEDVDFFERLLAGGARGFYVPDLIIYHYIPPYRLTRRYHREWCYRRLMATAEHDVSRRQPVPHILGVPRYRVGCAVRSAVFVAASAARGQWNTSSVFSRELAIWELAGYVAGALKSRFSTSGRLRSGTLRAPTSTPVSAKQIE